MDRGEVLDPRTETPPSFIRSVWYAASALHLGRFAAPLPRALLFLSGLLSAGMMAAGLLLWEKARERKTGDSVPKGVYAANTAVIAGLPLSVAAYFWMNRLLDADLPQRATWESLTFFFTWACCLTHAWARDKPAGRGEQLAAAGLALALLPFLNGLTGGEALPDTLFHGPAQLAGFDIFALLAGMGLFGAGFRSLRRSRTASPLHALRGRIAEMLDRTAARVRGQCRNAEAPRPHWPPSGQKPCTPLSRPDGERRRHSRRTSCRFHCRFLRGLIFRHRSEKRIFLPGRKEIPCKDRNRPRPPQKQRRTFMLSLCAALMMLAACCLLAPGTDRDSAAPAPLVFRWRKGWLPLGLTLLFACRAYGPAVGVVTWFGLLAPRRGSEPRCSWACAPEAARDCSGAARWP